LKNLRERLAHLETIVTSENTALETLEEQKLATEEEIAESEHAIVELQNELKELQEVLDAKTKVVEQTKRTSGKAAKVLDQALKEIGSMVWFFSYMFQHVLKPLRCDRTTKLRSSDFRGQPFTESVG
jgi:chromosome segregation ATPase